MLYILRCDVLLHQIVVLKTKHTMNSLKMLHPVSCSFNILQQSFLTYFVLNNGHHRHHYFVSHAMLLLLCQENLRNTYSTQVMSQVTHACVQNQTKLLLQSAFHELSPWFISTFFQRISSQNNDSYTHKHTYTQIYKNSHTHTFNIFCW